MGGKHGRSALGAACAHARLQKGQDRGTKACPAFPGSRNILKGLRLQEGSRWSPHPEEELSCLTGSHQLGQEKSRADAQVHAPGEVELEKPLQATSVLGYDLGPCEVLLCEHLRLVPLLVLLGYLVDA